MLVLTVGLSGTVFMESESPSIVEEWVYREMELLYREGLIPDYPREWVNFGNQLSRFEIAYYIKSFISNEFVNSAKRQGKTEPILESKLNAIRKLVAEFHGELTAMGIEITDINTISPNLNHRLINTDVYQDLDLILAPQTGSEQKSHYYFGEYLKDIYRKSFLFLPEIFVKEDNQILLQGSAGKINIVSHPNRKENPPYLVVKGNLPVDVQKSVSGYYLFPLDETIDVPTSKSVVADLSDSVLDLLDEVNHLRQMENLWRFSGSLSLKGYSRLEADFQSKLEFRGLSQGLKIGGYLIKTDTEPDPHNLGLPFYSSRKSTAIDLDNINQADMQSFQINIKGNVALNNKTSITGELELLYRGDASGRNVILPSDTKAGAGLEYQLSDYWAILSYQSFVNSQVKSGPLSTTSLGVEYNNWLTLWLAYQVLDFDDSRLTGAFTFRF
ncbi:MAG: hypothetical protein GX075_10055 [Firmicutes bacterium]|nr:hypothetical protein [Bacillota bacterium]